MRAALNNLRIETAGTEAKAEERLEAALEMKVEEARGDSVEVEEGGDGTLREIGALEFLTQDAEPSRTTLVDALNVFDEMSRLEMLWTVRHRWLAGARFAFNWYRHWAQLLLRQLVELLVTILSR